MLMRYIWEMQKSSTSSLLNATVTHYTHDRGSLLFKSIFCIFILTTIYKCIYFCVHISSLVFLSLKMHVHCLIL